MAQFFSALSSSGEQSKLFISSDAEKSQPISSTLQPAVSHSITDTSAKRAQPRALVMDVGTKAGAKEEKSEKMPPQEQKEDLARTRDWLVASDDEADEDDTHSHALALVARPPKRGQDDEGGQDRRTSLRSHPRPARSTAIAVRDSHTSAVRG
jgi:hypothetical protein